LRTLALLRSFHAAVPYFTLSFREGLHIVRVVIALALVLVVGLVVAWAVAPVLGGVVAGVAALAALPVLVRRQET
jgi:hypothetical protein